MSNEELIAILRHGQGQDWDCPIDARIKAADRIEALQTQVAELESWKAAEDAHHHALRAQVAQLEAELAGAREGLSQTRVDSFNHGYLVAVSTMLHQHDEPVIAEDALRDSGLSLAVAKALDLDPFDMDILRPIWAEIEQKRKLPPRALKDHPHDV